MDNGAIIGLVGLITAIFTGLGLILARIKHSECLRGCCEIDTRSPTRMDSVLSRPPTPHIHHKQNNNNHDKQEENKSEFKLEIIDTDV